MWVILQPCAAHRDKDILISNMPILEETNVSTREEVILKCYQQVFPLAAAHIQRRSGRLEEAKEVFQEAMLLYFEKLSQEGFQPAVNDQAYLMGMVKKLWLKHQGNPKSVSLDHWDQAIEEQPQPITQKLLNYLRSSGERCLDLLQSFYYEKCSMRQVADRFGYASERSATVQKYKCLEKVREQVRQNAQQYEDFFE